LQGETVWQVELTILKHEERSHINYKLKTNRVRDDYKNKLLKEAKNWNKKAHPCIVPYSHADITRILKEALDETMKKEAKDETMKEKYTRRPT